MKQFSRTAAAIIWVGLAMLLLAAPSSHATEPKRILLVHSFNPGTSPYSSVASEFRKDVLAAWPGQAAFYDFALEIGRPVSDNEATIVAAMRSRFANMKLDLVVAVGPPASHFYGTHRAALFPSVPFLMVGMDQRIAPVKYLEPGEAVVGVRLSPAEFLLDMLALLPGTTTVAVVFGDSPGERFWANELRREFAPFENQISFLWLNNLSLPELRERVATLKQGTVVLYGLFLADAAGIPYEGDYVITELHAASSVPIFSFLSTDLGKGTVGGALASQVAQGRIGADVASRMLRGENGSEVSTTFLEPTPEFDWRELQRWNIGENRLPPDSVVLFRPPSIWEEHKSLVVTGIAAFLLQALLITALIMQLKGRKRAEHESFALSSRLLTAHEDERRRLARELHDDITQRLASVAIDAARLESVAPLRRDHDRASQSVHGELVRLSEDVHALSYRLHPSILDDLGLAEALKAECEQVSRHQAVRVDVELHQVPDTLPNDVALCIFRIAQEALGNVARHAKASVARVTLALSDGGLLLAVTDNGVGFDVNATRSRPSLGHASMSERVRVLGGRLGIRSASGQGTTLSAWVPLGGAS